MSARRRAFVAALAVTATTLAGAAVAHAAIGDDESANPAYRFAAQIQVGAAPDHRGCSGALVAAQWVLTAKACVGAGAPAGAPAEPVTVTVGRTDLTATTTGRVLTGTRLAPHPDRDLVLIRLAARVTDVPPVPVATTAPRAGDELRLLGYGRTATAWVPDRLHGATATVATVGTATLDVTPAGTGAICKGDAGGPALRTTGGRAELVAVHHASGQQGCLDAAGTTPDVIETRVDDVAAWIAATTVPTCNTAGSTTGTDQGGTGAAMADWTGDCIPDATNQNTAGELHAFRGTGTVPGLFPSPRRYIGAVFTVARFPRLITGDITGDGRTDLIGQNADGELRAWSSTGDLSTDGRLLHGGVGTVVGTGWRTTQVETILTADFDGDGRSDILGRYADGRLRVWRSTGDLSADHRLLSGGAWQSPATFLPATYPRILAADLTGDGHADLIAQHTDGRLFAWPSSGQITGSTALFPTSARLIGEGWREASVQAVLLADVTGDGRTDIGARYADGRLRFWQSSGDLSGDAKLLNGPRSLVKGTYTPAGYPRVLLGDADNDGRDDLFLQAADGTLNLFRSTGDASADEKLFPSSVSVGSGWTVSAYPRIF